MVQAYNGQEADKRMFNFEDEGDFVQLKAKEYPNGNVQNLAQGFEGVFNEDKRMFNFEDEGDYVQLKSKLRSKEYPNGNV